MNASQLGDILRARSVERVWCLHADHFEPWQARISEERSRWVRRFADLASRHPFTRRMSLFYKPHIAYVLDAGRRRGEDYRRVPDDGISFRFPSAELSRIAARAWRYLLDLTEHEVHVHLHHEGYTSSGHNELELARWLAMHSNSVADRARFELQLRMSLEQIERETGRTMHQWGFVHGCWALNGSDRTICRIDDEISVLLAHGCVGDFSFPAPRPHCNPTLLGPLTCVPAPVAKCYAEPVSDARTIAPGARVMTEGRFFVWSAPEFRADEEAYRGLDYCLPVRADPARALEQWLRHAPVIGNDLFIKTYCHSMTASHWEEPDRPQLPLLASATQRLFSLLETACERGSAELAYATVTQVMNRLRTLDSEPATGRSAAAGA